MYSLRHSYASQVRLRVVISLVYYFGDYFIAIRNTVEPLVVTARMLRSCVGKFSVHVALMRAIEVGDLLAVRHLVNEKGADVNCTDPDSSSRETAIMWAVIFDQVAIARFLLDQGACLSPPNDKNDSLLHLIRSTPMGRLLLERGVPVNSTNIDGQTPLHAACKKDLTDIVRLLIDNGADVDVRDHYGRTALHHVSGTGHDASLVRLLLERGANVNIPDDEGCVPLHYVARCHFSSEVAELLLSFGADATLRDEYDDPPYVTATEQLFTGFDDTSSVEEVLRDAYSKEMLKRISLLIQTNASRTLIPRTVEHLRCERSVGRWMTYFLLRETMDCAHDDNDDKLPLW